MKGQTKAELIAEATKAGFTTQYSPGCPVWFIDMLQNQDIMIYLATIQK